MKEVTTIPPFHSLMKELKCVCYVTLVDCMLDAFHVIFYPFSKQFTHETIYLVYSLAFLIKTS